MKVSIVVIAYNQADTINKTLEGIVNQKTNFDFEVIVNDDCSTDGTREIIERYAKRYPKLIKPVLRKENIFSKGASFLEIMSFDLINGEYFAFCEGDDYWIDANKLQTQVDFLDNNPDFSGCFHKSLRKNIITGEDVCYKPNTEELKNKDIFTIHETLNTYFIETCSVMYRWNKYKNELSKLYPANILNMDSYFIYFFSLKGKIKYIDKLMSVKTINESGVWNSVKQSIDERQIRFWLEIINFPIEIKKLLCKFDCNLKYYESPENAAKRVLNSAVKLKRFDIIGKLTEKFPEIFSDILNQQDNKDSEIFYLRRKIKKYKKRNLILTIFCIILIVSLIISIIL